jgi:uncharacterized protein with ParB-like and HNH nuclease domain
MAGGYEKAITIEKAIGNIVARRYLLPAIQRKFTWWPRQICVLFDSIMRGYPINTFMLWEVSDQNVKRDFRFYQFLENFCERFGENNPDFDTKGHGSFYAVIDGQQRLTSLYIGLKGTFAYKLPRKWWPKTKDDTILPPRRLYLDLQQSLDEEENEGMMSYNFRFLTKGEYERSLLSKEEYWFLVGDVLEFDEVETDDGVLDIVQDYLDENDLATNRYARKALTRLYFAIRRDPAIHYYNEWNQGIDHVLDIFIRTNSGGTPLAFSDLLMSIAVANWKRDAREQVDDLVDQVRFGADMEFSINRDLVLKSCLMLTDADVRFKVKNFNQITVQAIETAWDEIKKCLLESFRLVRSFGLNDSSLRAKNAVIPIAYYLYHKGRNASGGAALYASINNKAYHVENRKTIRIWLQMSLLRRAFGGQSDALLTTLRRIIKGNIDQEVFPLEAIAQQFRGTNKDILFDEDFIERLIATQKDDSACFSILALLFPDIDYSRSLNIDHLHPAAGFTASRLDASGLFGEDSSFREFYENPENWNGIANLHLLDESLNKSKQDRPLEEWIERDDIPLRPEDLLIPSGTDLSFSQFKPFIEARRRQISQRLLTLVGGGMH